MLEIDLPRSGDACDQLQPELLLRAEGTVLRHQSNEKEFVVVITYATLDREIMAKKASDWRATFRCAKLISPARARGPYDTSACLRSQTTSPAAQSSSPPALASRQAPAHRLHLSDKLEIQMPFSPQYNETAIVQPDGRISLHELNRCACSAKPFLKQKTLIAEAYRGILNKPVVSVQLQEFLKPSFYASGEVGRPGATRSSATSP